MDDTEALAAAHARWHAERIAALTRPDGWLTLIGLVWLDDGAHRVGSATGNDILLPAGAAQLGTLHVAGTVIAWQPHAGPVQTMRSDAGGEPTVIREGGVSFFAIERDGRLALRIRDENAATRRDFAGIDCYAYDPAWRIAAAWDGHAASFRTAGREFRLTPQNSAVTPLQFVIADATSGRETYGGGRFLFAGPVEGGRLVLDFNRAINPPCAFTPFAVCPLPPASNRLPLEVRAGERKWTAAEH